MMSIIPDIMIPLLILRLISLPITMIDKTWITRLVNKNIKNAIKHLLTFNQKRCTHLGCALRYNASEDTYECPCHGSKYDKNGKVIVGPALKDLKKNK